MKQTVATRLAANDGVLTARELASLAVDRQATARLVTSGLLRRVRQGAYVDPVRWEHGSAVDRHVLQARAVLRTLDGYAGSHLSAVALHGLPVVAESLGSVDVCRVGEPVWRRRSDLRVRGAVGPDSVVTARGVAAVNAELALVQVARTSVRDALIAADAGLRAGRLSRASLAGLARGAGGRGPGLVVDLASALSESPGESWTRFVFHALGMQQPEQQVDIHDTTGAFVARVDFLFRAAKVVVEFDGAVKYAGADGREALVGEKRREDALRALGYRVVRLTWSDLRRPQRVRALLGEGVGRC